MNNSGSLYQKNYSLVLNVNPRLSNLTIMPRRQNATEGKKAPEPVKGVSYKNLTLGVARETLQNEKRVALTPAITQNMTKKGFKVVVEENAGLAAKFSNEQYEQAGAKIASVKGVYSAADILLKVRAPTLNVRKMW